MASPFRYRCHNQRNKVFHCRSFQVSRQLMNESSAVIQLKTVRWKGDQFWTRQPPLTNDHDVMPRTITDALTTPFTNRSCTDIISGFFSPSAVKLIMVLLYSWPWRSRRWLTTFWLWRQIATNQSSLAGIPIGRKLRWVRVAEWLRESPTEGPSRQHLTKIPTRTMMSRAFAWTSPAAAI